MEKNIIMGGLLNLLDHAPMVTQEQAVEYLSQTIEGVQQGQIDRTISTAYAYHRIWIEEECREIRGREEKVLLLSRDKATAQNPVARVFPYAFELYLAADHLDTPCDVGDHPFCAVFQRPREGKGDILAQVAVLDCGRGSALSLAVEVHKSTLDFGREWLKPYHEPPGSLSDAFWRALILQNMPDGFLKTKDFQCLQGLGFTHFFAVTAGGYAVPPKLVQKESEKQTAWRRFLYDSEGRTKTGWD